MNNGKGFSKISKPTKGDGAYHFVARFPVIVFRDVRLELGNRVNGKEISDVPFRTEKKRTTSDLVVVDNFRTDFPEITVPFDFQLKLQLKFPEFLS